MKHTTITWAEQKCTVRVAEEAGEFHVMIETRGGYLESAIDRLCELPELKGATMVMKRYFLSAAADESVATGTKGVAVSTVVQPPLGDVTGAVWLWFVRGAEVTPGPGGEVSWSRDGYTHILHTRLCAPAAPSVGAQTGEIFNGYTLSLARHGCTLERDCIRTWIFVRDVDTRYCDMVDVRRNHFTREGLTPQTHYIASTGIQGHCPTPGAEVAMDAYAVRGLAPEQITYLKAPSHMNPTWEYGVTFERGTMVSYGDRRHIFISGTASIDNRGEVVHVGDVALQTERAFENVRVLLAEAGAGMGDVAQMIVYLRNEGDFAAVDEWLTRNCGNIPRVVVLAPVCRPDWLVEVECVAITATHPDA
jgi:enamine deaminase RidA (YjgF/YER057c/UK114 family)